MTEHEDWVMRHMWKRGFTVVDIAHTLGNSVKWIYDYTQRNRDKFPYRKPRLLVDRRDRPGRLPKDVEAFLAS